MPQWGKLIVMNKAERESFQLREKQKRLARQYSDEILAEKKLQKIKKAERKAEHIARMQAIADAKKKKRR